MQISVDTNTETPASLRLTAALLTFIANFKENPQSAGLPMPQFVPPPAPAPQPSAPQPSAPTAESNPTPAPSTQVILPKQPVDSIGEEWNPEIHTANQSKNTDGTWRRKRTQKETAPTARTVELPKLPPAPPPPPVVEPAATVPPATVVAADPPAPPAVPPAPPAPTAVPPDHGITTFPELVKKATTLIGTKKITTPKLLEACASCGVADIHALSLPQNASKIADVATAILARVKE